jgi:hypothetical protein
LRLEYALASFDNRLQWVADLVLQGVVEHAFELVLGLDLLVKHTKSNVLEECQGLGLIIDLHLLVHDVNQKFGVFLILVHHLVDP